MSSLVVSSVAVAQWAALAMASVLPVVLAIARAGVCTATALADTIIVVFTVTVIESEYCWM